MELLTKGNRLSLLLLQVFLGLGVAGYAHLGGFSRMLADDFCSAYYANRLGLLRSIWYWYVNWSGRYSAFVADWFVLKLAPGPYGIHTIVPIMIILWLVFLTLIFHRGLRHQGAYTLLQSTVLGSSFLFTLFLLSPFIPQSLFWWNGARSYSPLLMLLTLWVLFFRGSILFPKLSPKIVYGLSFTMLFFIGGMGETYAVGQVVFILFLIFLNLLNRGNTSTRDLHTLYAGLAGAILSIVMIILAPGNAIRQSTLPPSPGPGTLISISLQGYAVYIRELVNEPAKITGLLGAILLCIWTGTQNREHISSDTRLILINLAGGFALSFMCFPPGVYGYSEPPPSRTLIIPTFFLLAGILYASYLTGGSLSTLPSFRVRGNWIMAACLILTGYSTVIHSMDLWTQRQEYVEFARKWDEVDRLILDAKAAGQPSVAIPAMNNWAHLEVPTDNPLYWVTYCYTKYYGIQVYGPPFDEVIKIYQQQEAD